MVKQNSALGRKTAPSDGQLQHLAERLRDLVHKSGGNAEIAKRTGIPLRTLNGYLGGEAEPRLSTLELILGACGTTVAEFWAPRDGEAKIRLFAEVGAGFVFVPKLEVRASAGAGQLAPAPAIDGDVVAFREDWMRRIGLHAGRAQALVAVGDSMEPTIRDGDLLLIDRSIDHVMDNGIYVVVLGGYVMVKRMQIRRDGSVVLRSDNADRYDDEVVPAEDVHELIVEGRVRWFGRTI